MWCAWWTWVMSCCVMQGCDVCHVWSVLRLFVDVVSEWVRASSGWVSEWASACMPACLRACLIQREWVCVSESVQPNSSLREGFSDFFPIFTNLPNVHPSALPGAARPCPANEATTRTRPANVALSRLAFCPLTALSKHAHDYTHTNKHAGTTTIVTRRTLFKTCIEDTVIYREGTTPRHGICTIDIHLCVPWLCKISHNIPTNEFTSWRPLVASIGNGCSNMLKTNRSMDIEVFNAHWTFQTRMQESTKRAQSVPCISEEQPATHVQHINVQHIII